MNKKQAAAAALIAAGAFFWSSMAAGASDSVLWVLTGTAAETDGSVRRIAVPEAGSPSRTESAGSTVSSASEDAPAALPETAQPSPEKTEAAESDQPSAVSPAAETVPPAAEEKPMDVDHPAQLEASAPGSLTASDEQAVQQSPKEVQKAAPEGAAAPVKSAEKEQDARSGAASSISPANPMVVQADTMSYRGTTGDVDLQGRVDITHMQDRYQTEHVYGNSQTEQYVIPGTVRWTSPGNDVTAEQGTYDGKTSVATFEGIKGWNQGKYYYEGESGVYDRMENKAVVQKGYFTTKHAVAKVPDYRIEADSIDIYPNDHYKAHNARLFIKNTQIMSVSSYTGSLDRDGNAVNLWTVIPVPDYESGNGFGLKNRIEIPVGGADSDLAFYARLAWYSQEGFKPDVGFLWDTAPGTFKLRYAKEESTLNDDHIWIEMWPSFSFDSRHFYIPQTNFYVGASGDIGHWKEGSVSGSHKLWNVYLSHDPIELGPHLDFSWQLGYRRDYYGYDDSMRSNRYYTVGLHGKYGIWSPWITYEDNHMSGHTPYRYDTYDMEKPLYTGVKVQLTPLDAVSVEYAIDTINGHTDHKYFTYYRDLHSFTSWIQYDTVDEDFEFMIQPKDFSF